MQPLLALALLGAALAAPAVERRQEMPTLTGSSSEPLKPTTLPGPSSATASRATAAVSATSAAPSASASNNVTAQFLAAVRARDAESFASLLDSQPALVQQIVSLAGTQQPYTVILPGSLDDVTVDTSNSTAVADLVRYHILPGNYSAASLAVNETNIVPSALTDYEGVQGPQVVVLRKNVYGTTHVLGASNATILANSTFSNFLFKLADRALTLPTNVSNTILVQPDSSALGALLGQLPQLSQQIDMAGAVTAFAPDNQVVQQSLSRLGNSGLGGDNSSGNSTTQQIINNHIIFNQTLYSTNLTSASNVQNANGGSVTFNVNATGAYVTSGGNTARIIRADINAVGGVVHIIDAPLYAPPTSGQATNSSATATSSMSASTASPVSTLGA